MIAESLIQQITSLTNPPSHHHTNQAESTPPIDCVAVEDSGSGVGSAANAGMGKRSFMCVCTCVVG